MAKVYVASSWRNSFQDVIVKALEALGHEVYDFKNPHEGQKGFNWREVDPNWESWTVAQYQKGLQHTIAQSGFKSDLNAMEWAESCVLVMPCGRSAHLEAGWFAGKGKQLMVYVPPETRFEPELMYLLADDKPIVTSVHEMHMRLIHNK